MIYAIGGSATSEIKLECRDRWSHPFADSSSAARSLTIKAMN
jgi:hypothetical protein